MYASAQMHVYTYSKLSILSEIVGLRSFSKADFWKWAGWVDLNNDSSTTRRGTYLPVRRRTRLPIINHPDSIHHSTKRGA